MVQKAIVVKTDDGRLMAQVERSEMCASCKACQFGQTQTHLVELPAGDFKPGDEVDVTLPNGSIVTYKLLTVTRSK